MRDGAGKSNGSGGDGAQLSRDLGVYAVFATAAGTMIGAGIFILPGLAAEAAGPAASISFLLAGGIALITAFSVCELATAMPRAGGGYYFVSRAMGPLVGSVIGLGAWIALVFKGSFALVGFAEYLVVFVDAPLVGLALATGLVLIVVNLTGAKVSGVIQNMVVALLLLLMGIFVVWGAFAADIQTMRPLFPHGFSGVLAGTGLVFISYLGIEKAAAISEEVRDPERTIPRGIISAVVVVTLLYVGTMLVVTGVIPLPDLVGDGAPVATSAGVFMGGIGLIVMAIAGLLATASTGNAAVLSSSRYPFAMARDHLMSGWLNDISRRFGTPVRSILMTGGLMLALLLIFDVEQLAKLGSAFNVLVFALVNGAVILLRRSAPEWYRPAFRVPLAPVLPALGALSALALLPTMGLLAQVMALGFVGVGIWWYFWYRERGEGLPYPRYDIGDQIARIRDREALRRKRKAFSSYAEPSSESAVVVELEEGRPNRILLTIARSLAVRRKVGVDVVVVTEVPLQTPLAAGSAPIDAEWESKVRKRLGEGEREVRVHHVLARSRARAVLNLLDRDTEAVLLDWHGPLRVHRLRDSHVDVVMKEAPTRVGVLKGRGFSELKEIVVAAGGGPYERTEVDVADAIAASTGGRLTFLRILPPDPAEERLRSTEKYMEELVEMVESPAEAHILHDDDIVEAFGQATYGADLLVLGASREAGFRRTVFGRLVDRIARRVDTSVLITKDPETYDRWTKKLQRRLFEEV